MSLPEIISGNVVHGQKLGRTLGFPTANIDRDSYVERKLDVPHGVYGGMVTIGGRQYRAGIVVGPLDSEGLPKLEAHLIGFSGNLYGKLVTFTLEKFLRPYRSFDSVEALTAQIAQDIEQIASY